MEATITLAELDNGKLAVIGGPDDDTDGQIAAVEKMTDAGGALGRRRVRHVAVVRIYRAGARIVTTRHDMIGNAPAAPVGADAEE